MSETIEVKAQQDFWKRLISGAPIRAVAEIVSNAFDADANQIKISIKRNSLGAVTRVIFSDDGSGIPYASEQHLFSQLGNSWKLKATRSREEQRLLQGRNGEGRFRALSLGEMVTWSTTYKDGDDLRAYNITASHGSLGQFLVSDIIASSENVAGTVVTIDNVFPRVEHFFTPSRTDELSRVFAPYLNKYRSVSVTYDGTAIDVQKIVLRSSEAHLGPYILSGGEEVRASLEVIEWSAPLGRALYLCDETGFTFSERAPEVRAPGFDFGAYLKSSHFSELQAASLADVDMEEGLARLLREAREYLSAYFRKREKEKASSLIQKWKNEAVYPFHDDETSPVTKQAKRIFNMCAVTIHDHAKGFDEQSRVTKALSFRLLREAIEERPQELSKLLSEVLGLSKEKQKQFSMLLDKTKLSDILDAVSFVGHRMNTAIGLRSLVCSDDTKATMKERQHIHQIVERNPWLFGEEFTLGQSESSLTNALREHLKRLKMDARMLEPVLPVGGKNARIDLMLCQTNKRSGRDDDHHLIVELKRASKSLSHTDFAQLMRYANTIMKDARYNKTNVEWSFWLIGTDVAEDLDTLVNSSDRPAGCAHIFKEGRGRVWVKTWGQILHDCITRHQFVKDKLNIAITDDDAVHYLNEIYPDFIPQAAE
ncbi:hypothetical protein FJ934_27315 [Mesorhizobium sp. B2-4-12]|uniref:ATP-binding protein n=1 Tax=Mesorhizobium sp. B2-4-12 TaxID=2589937 RepID=UPI00112AFD22|nr:ATP-binding protein [Mesorhizobium sp. B2-4-12]TPK85356.1 hypothetical protein FJ934_27315 [Mesorhizobium sp. B2-4-12]